MNASFLTRLLFIGVVRFIGLIALLLWYQNFEVSPLPAWTLDIFVLLVQFGWTFFCTRWALRRRFPTQSLFTAIVIVFLVGQIFSELWLTKRLTGATWNTTVRGAIAIGSFLQIAWHLGAMSLGYWRSKRKRLAERAPDETNI